MLKVILQNLLKYLRFEDDKFIGIACWLVIVYCALLSIVFGKELIELVNEVKHNKQISKNSEKVEALVVGKECNFRRTVIIGKVPVSASSVYTVELLYDKKKYTINNGKLYNEVEVGDYVKVKLLKYISKDGKVVDAKLEIGS